MLVNLLKLSTAIPQNIFIRLNIAPLLRWPGLIGVASRWPQAAH